MQLQFLTNYSYSLIVEDIDELLDIAERADLLICTSVAKRRAEVYVPMTPEELRRQWLQLDTIARAGRPRRELVNQAWTAHYLKANSDDLIHHEGRVNGVAGNIYVQRNWGDSKTPWQFEIRGNSLGTALPKEAGEMLSALGVRS